MKWRPASAVGAVVLALTCGCANEPTFKSPPAGSYTVENRQVKLGGTVSTIQAAAVTLDFFRAAEVRPFLGRFFVEVDGSSAAQQLVVLSHALWTERFGSSPGVIGQTIELDGRPATVVGIAQPGFRFPDGTLLWTQKNR
jgi:MacB-like periplasmic core domain